MNHFSGFSDVSFSWNAGKNYLLCFEYAPYQRPPYTHLLLEVRLPAPLFYVLKVLACGSLKIRKGSIDVPI
jgi:hypothetical protein